MTLSTPCAGEPFSEPAFATYSAPLASTASAVVSLIALAILAHVSFDMPYWQSVLAVVMSFALALVACRVTGETDTTPIGAMGKVTQLTFGALNPGNVEGLHWGSGLQTIPLQHYRDRYYDPGLLAKHFGFHAQSPRTIRAGD